ncbi:WD domain G-beta repeat domain containing protein [Plasmodium cynomolgi strain B]|uniref:WD domain G-beta repeat domain containing protein n=1 Tax=Plasmodium cynomolgi (strain B) TaxID=1120755 RepID=K6UY55_PLACD|nr:WD domain G-beta repeat domain containing protein [Plasmodium cynomolgi strain B]GAB68779.1 WD domain G-beta repeat domain containing protein [Plasmodium cynomolgi strain B]
MANNLNVAAPDVIRLILQYLKENNLMRSFYVLQEESNVKLNAVSNVDLLIRDIHKGDWKNVLYNITTIELSDETLINLYEQLICELIEYKENELAEKIMSECIIFKKMKKMYGEKYHKLEDLLSMNSMALKWQNHHNLIKKNKENNNFDIFRNLEKNESIGIDVYPERILKSISFGKESNVECCICSYTHDYLITGSSDGFIEIWSWLTGQLNSDLTYQYNNNIMMHDNPIVSLCISKDDEILISADSKGLIKIWKIKTGSCLRSINAHTNAVTSVHFNNDQTQILTSSYDLSVKIFGLKSLKCLKEFRKHSTVVHSSVYSLDNSKVICGTEEGKIFIYNQKTCECITSFYVYYNIKDNINFPSVHTITLLTKTLDELILVCSKSPYCYLMNFKGQIIKTYTYLADKVEEENPVHFVSACLSPNSKYVYCLAENQYLYCFNYSTAKLETQLKVLEEDALGVLHHTSQDLMATWALDGTLNVIQ